MKAGLAYQRLCPECRELDTSDSEGSEEEGDGEISVIFNAAMQSELDSFRRLWGREIDAAMGGVDANKDWVGCFKKLDAAGIAGHGSGVRSSPAQSGRAPGADTAGLAPLAGGGGNGQDTPKASARVPNAANASSARSAYEIYDSPSSSGSSDAGDADTQSSTEEEDHEDSQDAGSASLPQQSSMPVVKSSVYYDF